MERMKCMARICAFMLAIGLITAGALPVFAAGVRGGYIVDRAIDPSEDTGSDSQEKEDGSIYVDGKLYSGYYMDNAGIFYTVSNGIAAPKTGTVSGGTKYYSQKGNGIVTLLKQTVFVKGRVYTGYYMDQRHKMYRVKKGTRTLQTGTVKAGTAYYDYHAGKTLEMPKQTFHVRGEVYTGYYVDPGKRMYSVKKGTRTLQTGTIKAGSKYYDYHAGKSKRLPKQTFYVRGEVYTGYYVDPGKRMYSVKKGTRTLKTGTVKTGSKYYDYHAGKSKRLPKQTFYVRGKVYTGHYMDRKNKMYRVKRGTRTLETGILRAGTKYYSLNAKKMRSLAAQTVYINGKAEEGMSAESFATFQRAQAVVARVTNASMTKEQKLRACFDFVKTYPECSPRMPHYLGMDWPVIYANDMFVRGTGNCCSYAAAFAYMAKVIGYREVYCCNSGGHGWAEIDGLVYDPEWSKHYHVYSYYALSYDTRTDQDYKGAIGARRPWMHVKI